MKASSSSVDRLEGWISVWVPNFACGFEGAAARLDVSGLTGGLAVLVFPSKIAYLRLKKTISDQARWCMQNIWGRERACTGKLCRAELGFSLPYTGGRSIALASRLTNSPASSM